MWKDKQKMIKRILKIPALYGSPFTKYDVVAGTWVWDENVLQSMGAKEIERLMDVAQRV